MAGTTLTDHGAGYAITSVAIVDVEARDRAFPIRRSSWRAIGSRRSDRNPTSPFHPTHGRIDGRGLYLMPGLVDAHVHYYDPPVFGRLLIANGVVLVRDMGLPTDTILKVRDALNRGETLGPEMVATGSVLDGSPPLIPSVSVGLRTPAEGRAAVSSTHEPAWT